MFGEKGEALSVDKRSADRTTVLKEDASFEGKLMFEGTVCVDGKFKGEVFSSGDLAVGSTGIVEGQIEIGAINILGEVRGNIKASRKIVINAPAVVRGDIVAPSLIIEEGAVFEGSCSMGDVKDRTFKSKIQKDNVLDLAKTANEDM